MVTGASRGVGRGVAIGLVDAGFQVFATGRSILTAELPEAVVRIPCDHLRKEQTKAAFARVAAEAGDLDLLVNSAWGGYERMVEDGRFTWPLPFWEQPGHRWTGMLDAGVRAAFESASEAAPMMLRKRRGLIVNISFWAARKHLGNVIYGVAKAAPTRCRLTWRTSSGRMGWPWSRCIPAWSGPRVCCWLRRAGGWICQTVRVRSSSAVSFTRWHKILR